MLLGSGLGAIAFVAFLVFAVSGLIWLVVTLQQADPAVTRRTTAMVALVAGAILVAVLVAQALFGMGGGAYGRGFGTGMMNGGTPGIMRPPFRAPGGLTPQQPGQVAPAPAAPVQPFRPGGPGRVAPSPRA